MKLVEKCRDMTGALPKAHQDILEKLLETPTDETWEIARLIVVSPAPVLTLDMAVKRVSNQTTEKIPSSFTVYRAIRYAIEKHSRFLSKPAPQNVEAV